MITIKGKQYVTVSERVKFFRAHYPNFSTTTEILYFDNNNVVIRASVLDENGRIRATGIAQENKDNKQSMVNATSFVENAETSAIGRALGLFGIGIDVSIASADEVAMAIAQQQANEGGLLAQAKKMKFANEVLEFYTNHQNEMSETEKRAIIAIGKELRRKELAAA